MNNWNSLLRMQEERKQDRRTQDLRIRNSGTPTWNKPLPTKKRVKRVRKPHFKLNNPFKNLNEKIDKKFMKWLGIEFPEEDNDATSNNDTQ